MRGSIGDWQEIVDPQGRVYYTNFRTGQSQWETPTEVPETQPRKFLEFQPAQVAETSDWQSIVDPHGQTYYVNYRLGITSWDKEVQTNGTLSEHKTFSFHSSILSSDFSSSFATCSSGSERPSYSISSSSTRAWSTSQSIVDDGVTIGTGNLVIPRCLRSSSGSSTFSSGNYSSNKSNSGVSKSNHGGGSSGGGSNSRRGSFSGNSSGTGNNNNSSSSSSGGNSGRRGSCGGNSSGGNGSNSGRSRSNTGSRIMGSLGHLLSKSRNGSRSNSRSRSNSNADSSNRSIPPPISATPTGANVTEVSDSKHELPKPEPSSMSSSDPLSSLASVGSRMPPRPPATGSASVPSSPAPPTRTAVFSMALARLNISSPASRTPEQTSDRLSFSRPSPSSLQSGSSKCSSPPPYYPLTPRASSSSMSASSSTPRCSSTRPRSPSSPRASTTTRPPSPSITPRMPPLEFASPKLEFRSLESRSLESRSLESRSLESRSLESSASPRGPPRPPLDRPPTPRAWQRDLRDTIVDDEEKLGDKRSKTLAEVNQYLARGDSMHRSKVLTQVQDALRRSRPWEKLD